jgi:hypothetical protein
MRFPTILIAMSMMPILLMHMSIITMTTIMHLRITTTMITSTARAMRPWFVQMFEVARSRRMCCSRVAKVST